MFLKARFVIKFSFMIVKSYIQMGGWGGRITRSRNQDHPDQHGKTLSLLKEIQKISWVWWCAPVIPATWKAEAGELLEPERWRLQWAEIVPLHFSLVIERDSVSKQENKNYLGVVAHAYIPATWEAEAGRITWTLQWAEIVPLHSSLGNRVRLHLKKKKPLW